MQKNKYFNAKPNMKKQLTRSKIDSNSKLLGFVCVRVFHPYLHAKSILLAKCIPSILIDPECSMGFSTNEKYQKPHVLVAKLLTQFIIFTRTISGPYAISCLECRQTNMFDAKTVILYWMSNITKFTVQQFLCEIHVDPLMGTSQTPVQVHWRLHVQHLIKAWVEHYGKGTTWVNMDAHWLGPLGMPTRHVAHTSLGRT